MEELTGGLRVGPSDDVIILSQLW